MPNIMITEQCNLRCEYCFAEKQLGDREMPLPAFVKALAFCTKDQPNAHIGIIGGEPTLHSDFENILKTAISSNVNSITVFTNGTNLEQYTKLLTNRKVGLLVNFNDAEAMGDELYNKMGTGILRLHKDYMPGNINLGLNIHKHHVPQLDDMLEMCKLMKLPKIRLSVSVPTMEYLKGQHILSYFGELKQTYIDVCTSFDAIGVAISQDCNYIPRCVFSHGEVTMLTDLSRKYSEKLQTRIDYISSTVCHPVVDILPDLKAIRCFGLSEELSVDINVFESLNELVGYFAVRLDNPLNCKRIGASCDNCRSLYIGCNMGCPRARLEQSA